MSAKKPLQAGILNPGTFFTDTEKKRLETIKEEDEEQLTRANDLYGICDMFRLSDEDEEGPVRTDDIADIIQSIEHDEEIVSGYSHYLNLPPEIRLLIYDFLFEGSRLEVISDHLSNVFVYWRNEEPDATNVLLVNKLIRFEAMQVLTRKTSTLSMTSTYTNSLNKVLTFPMPDQWKMAITRIEYENCHPGARVFLPMFPNLRFIGIGSKTFHIEENKRPSEPASFEVLSTMILGKVRKNKKLTFRKSRAWVSDAPLVKVILKVLVMNRRKNYWTSGWEAEVDVLNWQVLSIRQALFSKRIMDDYSPDLAHFYDPNFGTFHRKSTWYDTAEGWLAIYAD